MIAAAFGVIAIGAYLYAVGVYNGRFPERAFTPWRVAAFVAGVALMVFALLPPIDSRADASFAWHMTQHVVLMLVGPPLLLLGAPLLLVVAVPRRKIARRLRAFAQGAIGS